METKAFSPDKIVGRREATVPQPELGLQTNKGKESSLQSKFINTERLQSGDTYYALYLLISLQLFQRLNTYFPCGKLFWKEGNFS